ncbi:hypothetical protein DPV78_006584 [Talaromyces pinophilus]|nr:hypothetical protein DPV78_006584 [Talaromyces pinophilus]
MPINTLQPSSATRKSSNPQQDRSEYVIFTNLDQERFSRDFEDATDSTTLESYYPLSQILMT